jgi:hypothetical protein
MSDAEEKIPSAGPESAAEVARFASLFAGGDAHGTHGVPDWDEAKGKWAIKRTARAGEMRERRCPKPPRLTAASNRGGDCPAEC